MFILKYGILIGTFCSLKCFQIIAKNMFFCLLEVDGSLIQTKMRCGAEQVLGRARAETTNNQQTSAIAGRKINHV